VTHAGHVPGDIVRVRAVVSGRVQGVWYRESCRREAERLGVSGAVRNTAAGTVEIEAQGPRAAVDALLSWARRGPARAEVHGLEIDDLVPVAGARDGFRVAR
jgi:acylphosphatase